MARLVLFGDSQLTDASSRGVTKLGQRLRQRGHDVENLAVGGLDTRTALVLPGSSRPADWTVFCFGANDAAPWKRVPPDEFAANLQVLVRRASSRHVLVLGPAPVRGSDVPGSRTHQEAARYSTLAATVAAREGAAFIDLVDLLGVDDLAEDGVHLNDHGYDIIEELVTAAIEPAPTASEHDIGS